MFDTQLHLFLQQLPEHGVLLPLMLTISDWGYAPAYAVAILVASFAWHLRAGLSLLLAVILMSGTVSLVKHHTDLPRPTDVDSRLLDNGQAHRALVEAGQTDGFFALPPPEAIDAFRQQPRPRNAGFLSGHTGVTTALCTALLFCLRRPRRSTGLMLLLALPGVMAFSRLYLGRHFLADVVAGWAVGLLAGTLAVLLMLPRRKASPILPRYALHLTTLAVVMIGTVIPGLPPLVPGAMVGLSLLLTWLDVRGWPPAAYNLTSRLGSLTAGCLLTALTGGALWLLLRWLPGVGSQSGQGVLAAVTLPLPFLLWATIWHRLQPHRPATSHDRAS